MQLVKHIIYHPMTTMSKVHSTSTLPVKKLTLVTDYTVQELKLCISR